MKTYINCYYCNFYIEDTCECELGYLDDSECGEWEEEEAARSISSTLTWTKNFNRVAAKNS